MSHRIFVLILALAALTVLGAAASIHAHDTRPLYVEIEETEPGAYSVSWKVPITVAATNVPMATLPGTCRPLGPAVGTATAKSQAYSCAGDLSGEAVAISYPRFNPSISTLVHFARLSGETHSEVLSPDKSKWIVPAKESTWRVARDYTILGVEHILEGFDHLLFIVCLVLLAGSFRRVVITITGFTISHSITLGLAALGLVTVPVAAVEASIALSIVFVATELARGRRDTLTWRYPIAVSSTFGLLHGFGFAAVLSEIGLPQTEVPAALLFFNIGVEIGQILFVLGAMVLFFAGRQVFGIFQTLTFNDALTRVHRPAAYLVGTLAMFWTIERVSSFWV